MLNIKGAVLENFEKKATEKDEKIKKAKLQKMEKLNQVETSVRQLAFFRLQHTKVQFPHYKYIDWVI